MFINIPVNQHVCPNCGYCPCCGQRRVVPPLQGPYYPYPYSPYYQQPLQQTSPYKQMSTPAYDGIKMTSTN